MRLAPFLFLLFSGLNVFAQSFQWSAQYQFPAAGRGSGVVYDKNQNAIVCGTYYAYGRYHSLAGCFLAQYKKDGTQNWNLLIEDATEIVITYDKINNSILSGFCANGGYYINKYDNAGIKTSSNLVLPVVNGVFANRITSILADNSGGYVIAGRSGSAFTLGTFSFPDPPSMGANFFVARFDNKDSCVWVTCSSSGGLSYAEICLDYKNEIVVSGRIFGDFVIGTQTISSLPFGANVILKLDVNGNTKWMIPVKTKSNKNVEIFSICSDLNNNIFAYGIYGDTLALSCPASSSDSKGDLFLLQLNPVGQCMWVKTISGPGYETPSKLARDPLDDGVYIAGNFSGRLTAAAITLTSTPGDGFIMKFDNQGNAKWALATGIENFRMINIGAIAANIKGDVCITGQLAGYCQFGGYGKFNESYDFFVAGIFDKHLITGLQSNLPFEELNFFPNPTSGIVHGSLNEKDGKVLISVYDINGQKISESACETNDCDIDLSSQPSGIYLIHCTNGVSTRVFKQMR